MKIIGIIPARYNSTRFPGKPLADICGKPMIWHVYQRALKAKLLDEVYIATDDKRIQDTCNQMGLNVIFTLDSHSTGTDRVAECATIVYADYYVNIQGDEPMIDPKSIDIVVQAAILEKNENVMAINAFSLLQDNVDINDTDVVKVVMSRSNLALSYSRLPIPYVQNKLFCYYKQLGLYAFRRNGLKIFSDNTPHSLENSEGVEMLRFLENNYDVRMIEVHDDSVSVDTKEDLCRVVDIMTTHSNSSENE
jgi:3-deoxy-manno-octulosonate cytidylyltransferase (CMP-KDO synthetase)